MMRTSLLCCVVLTACGTPSSSDAGEDAGTSPDGGLFLEFTPPNSSGANSLLVTVSGEAAALEGFAFPPASSGEPAFVDGWEVTFEQVLVTLDHVTVNQNPDLNPNDASQTGALVTQVNGPWAVDLAKGGPLDAKEGNGRAQPLVRIAGSSLDPTTKYAFGFSLVSAQGNVKNVNLDAAAQDAYVTMASKGWAVFMKGTATWRGDAACRSTDATYDFGRYPKVVHFAFGFATPVDFKNCVNPELSPVDSRGVQTSTNAQTVAQVTLHLDHPFWEALTEDAPMRWDAIAARRSVASGAGAAMVEVTTEDLAMDLFAPRDAQGFAIPWRTCGPVVANERSSGSVSFDPVNVPVSPFGGAAGLKNVEEYMAYNLSSFGHLNNDGLCFPARQFPAPR